MIRHTVLFKVKAGTPNQVVVTAISDFLALKNKLSGLISIVGGKCHFHEQKSSNAFAGTFTHGFSMDFEDQGAYDAFLNDPVTHPAKDGIVNIAEGGYEGIVGFDFI
jgi:hypothetical protein